MRTAYVLRLLLGVRPYALFSALLCSCLLIGCAEKPKLPSIRIVDDNGGSRNQQQSEGLSLEVLIKTRISDSGSASGEVQMKLTDGLLLNGQRLSQAFALDNLLVVIDSYSYELNLDPQSNEFSSTPAAVSESQLRELHGKPVQILDPRTSQPITLNQFQSPEALTEFGSIASTGDPDRVYSNCLNNSVEWEGSSPGNIEIDFKTQHPGGEEVSWPASADADIFFPTEDDGFWNDGFIGEGNLFQTLLTESEKSEAESGIVRREVSRHIRRTIPTANVEIDSSPASNLSVRFAVQEDTGTFFLEYFEGCNE